MIQTYINGALRSDIELAAGGDLEETAAHKTSSSLTVRVPVSSTDLQECDYIKLTDKQIDSETTVFAGTIKEIKQQDMGTSGNIDFRVYDLTITGNADYVAAVFVDLQFPAGANMQQVLMGNQSGDAWYKSALGTFVGLKYRLAAEGITIGTVDDFSNYSLSEVAYLWGSYIADVLDSLADTAGAWWEITPDKVFSMRYKVSRENAPFTLDDSAPAYDLEPSRDSYTMYSAVRVEGGSGAGSSTIETTFSYGATLQYISNTEVHTRYPVDSSLDIWEIVPIGDGPGDEIIHLRIGWTGIDESNPDVDVLASYGSNVIKAANSFTFVTLDTRHNIGCSYQPHVPIVVRLVDKTLTAEIVAQHGGTGVVEYLLKDDTITDFGSATQAGCAFLKDNAKRAQSVIFKTRVPGFRPNQTIAGCDIPYYNVIGDYQVGAVTASILYENESPVWEYRIEASNVNYRDKLKAMFYTVQHTVFKLGDDLPAFDGVYLNNEIEIQTELDIRAIYPPTCADWEDQELTCSNFEALNNTCDAFENLLKEWNEVGNYLTQDTKNRIAQLISGNLTDGSFLMSNVVNFLPVGSGVAESISTIQNQNEVVNTFYINDSDYTDSFTGFDFGGNTSDGYVQNSEALIPVDKSPSNPLGPFALTVVKRDVVL